jgi:hypothetical protein
MDFIERLFRISPDGGNGSLEFLIVAVIIIAFIIVMTLALRQYFPKNFIEYLEQLGKRENNQRFDN